MAPWRRPTTARTALLRLRSRCQRSDTWTLLPARPDGSRLHRHRHDRARPLQCRDAGEANQEGSRPADLEEDPPHRCAQGRQGWFRSDGRVSKPNHPRQEPSAGLAAIRSGVSGLVGMESRSVSLEAASPPRANATCRCSSPSRVVRRAEADATEPNRSANVFRAHAEFRHWKCRAVICIVAERPCQGRLRSTCG
jgi:hypothetical protein